MSGLLISDKKIIKIIIIVSLIYMIPYTIDFVYLLTSRLYLADLSFYKIKTELTSVEIWFIFLRGIFYYFLGIFIFFIFQKKNYAVGYHICIDRKKLEFVFILFFALQIFFAFKFKIGAAGGHSANKFSTLMNLVSIESFFPIYYFLYRDKVTKKYLFVIFLYCVLKVVQGWSGFILSLFFMEVFYRIYKGKLGIYFILLIPVVILCGGFVYKIFYPIKIYFRTGKNESITYLESLVKLVTRLSCFSNSCAAYEFRENMFKFNSILSREHAEILYYFNAFVPSFVYDKSFAPLNQTLLLAVFNGRGGISNFDLGSTYYYLLFKLSIFDYILYFSLFIVSAIIYRLLLEFIVPSKKSIASILIIYMNNNLTLLNGSGLNTQSGWFFLIISIGFLYFLGILKIYKEKRVMYGNSN